MNQLEAQRLAFESQFGSLESMGFQDKTKSITQEEASTSESDAEASAVSSEPAHGSEEFSGDEYDSELDDGRVEEALQPSASRAPRVVSFKNAHSYDEFRPSKKEQRLVRSGKAPRVVSETSGKPTAAPESDDDETENLQNDIELQRFLKESHLLSAFQGNSDSHEDLHGKARARTMEARLQSLSQINAVKNRKLEKMPMNVRKGMVQKHVGRISKHEAEARDAGTVLSRVRNGEFRRIDATYTRDIERRIGRGTSAAASANSGSTGNARQRGLKIHSVGRTTRHGLKISASEIARVTGGPKNRRRR